MYSQKSKVGWIAVAVILLLGGGFLVWWFLLGGNGGETISCSKKGEILTQSVAVTYWGDDPTKIEYNFKFNVDKMPEDDDMSFSFSTDDGLKSDPEEAEILVASMMMLAFAKYDGEPGITYKDDEGTSVRNVTFVADLTKVDADLKKELTEDTPALEDFQREYIGDGFTCKKK